MQGRLGPPVDGRFQCFPRETWAKEFSLAAEAQLDCIEWIYDEYGADVNPIATDEGLESLRHAIEQYGVRVVSVCADYFMDRPLVRVYGAALEERLAHLIWLLGRCRLLGIERIVLPFVDASRIETDEELDFVISALDQALPAAKEAGIELHLETSLGPTAFAALLARLPAERVKVNYDAGNSASLGYLPQEEFAAYGVRVGSVHIKDRILGGGTVPLGTGDADLPAVFDGLHDLGYTGDLIMQVARGIPGQELDWTKRNREQILAFRLSAAQRGP